MGVIHSNDFRKEDTLPREFGQAGYSLVFDNDRF